MREISSTSVSTMTVSTFAARCRASISCARCAWLRSRMRIRRITRSYRKFRRALALRVTERTLHLQSPESFMRARILFLATTPDVSRAIAAMLESNNFHVTRGDESRHGAALLGAGHFDLLVVEVKASGDDEGL